MKHFGLIYLLFLLSIEAFSQGNKTHYKDYHSKAHYRSPGTRVWSQKKNAFENHIIAKHNHANVKPVVLPKPSAVQTDKTQTKKESEQETVVTQSNFSYSSESSTNLISKDSLSRLKALVIVADIDGPAGTTTKRFVAEGKETAGYLASLGISVQTTLCPDDSWPDIIAKGNGANILVYMGHGTHSGDDGKWGGFCLSKEIISSLTIRNQLKLAPNCIVLFNHVCGGAGSSAGDTDADIGVLEAKNRVSSYAHPFIDLNAALYYANNYDGCMQKFIRQLFSRKSDLNSVYENYVSYVGNKIEAREKYTYNGQYNVNISSSPVNQEVTYYSWSSNSTEKQEHKVFIKNQYEIALVYRNGFRIESLFK